MLVRYGTRSMPGIAGTAALPPTSMKMLRGEPFAADLDLVRRDEPGVAAVDGAVLRRAQRGLGRRAPRRDDGILALLHPSHVHRHAAADHHAELGGAARHVRGIGAGDHRLGRRAAGVDAGPAERLALDDGDALPGAGEALRKRRACLAAADDDGVIGLHGRPPWVGRRGAAHSPCRGRTALCHCRWLIHWMPWRSRCRTLLPACKSSGRCSTGPGSREIVAHPMRSGRELSAFGVK